MPKYLIRASYTAEGARGLLAEGGTGRRAAVENVLRPLGGTLESMYFAFGEEDLYCILDLPDHVSMAAVSLTVRASGALRSSAVALLDPEEVDAAARRQVDFRSPGV
ncbi:GYD domain-containing protein [Kitasatospora sp. NPDC088346]|uniref:GYD domain-containing protein n=1 Tax=Kitasatospora sp. NPDC088346 TaxID=3364073 RepID=UPI00382BA336